VGELLAKCEGIVIRAIDYGETSKIITVFSKELGKTSLMARGAKKPVSKLASVSQIFTQGHYLFHIGSGMGTLQQGEITQHFRAIHEDIVLLAYVTYIAECIDRITIERQPNVPLYESCLQIFHYLAEGYDPEVILQIFEVKMISLLGIAPELSQCVNCGEVSTHYAFSMQEGGLLCRKCLWIDPHKISISQKAIKLLRLFQMIDISRLGEISISVETKNEIRIVLDLYLEKNSGLYLKSKKFLRQVHQLQ